MKLQSHAVHWTRIPVEQLLWRPHEKSMTLGQLGLHIATLPGAIADMAMQSPCPAAPIPRPQPSSTTEILSAFDESVACSSIAHDLG